MTPLVCPLDLPFPGRPELGFPKRFRKFQKERQKVRKIALFTQNCATTVRVGSWQNGFFRGFLFLCRRIFSRIFSPNFFSSFLCGKKSAQIKILQENPRQNPPKFIQHKNPRHTFLQRGLVQQLRFCALSSAGRIH